MSDEQKDVLYFGSSAKRLESPVQLNRSLLTRFAKDAASSIAGLAGNENGINELQKWLSV